MAQTFKFDLRNFERKLSVYELSQANFAGKVALTKLAKRLKGSQGLRQRYMRIFDRPVSFTLNSTFTVQRGLELDVGIKDKIEKGNPAGKYLFPPIGVGSGRAYDTLFTQYLRNRNLIENTDYPIPATDHSLVKVNKRGNVTSGTYSSTVIALGKTRSQGKNRSAFKGGNSSIPDQRVFAITRDGASNNKKLKAGIYREQKGRGKNKFEVKALFFYKKIPTQSKGGRGGKKMFPEIVKDFTDAQLFKIWLREIKNLAKE
tara:strand:+ start:56 stop:832 length:777 start_codon:yes stop_codon:yes gene_type:complete